MRILRFQSQALVACILLISLTVTSVFAQSGRLNLDSLNHLADKASDTVDVTLDAFTFKLAGKFLRDDRVDEAELKQIITALKGVYVKSFEFDDRDEYTKADVETIRSQVSGAGWHRLVGIRCRNHENVDVFMMSDADDITGVVVIAAEARRLTVVNVVGPINIEKLSRLNGHFGIKSMDFEFNRDK